MTNWSAEQRLEFIEFRLFWENSVNRGDIVAAFGVSVPQASKDLAAYQDRAPGNAIYDKSSKRYIAGPDFTPVYIDPSPEVWLAHLRDSAAGQHSQKPDGLAQLPAVDLVLPPRRQIATDALRALVRALREGASIAVQYQSMHVSRPDPSWRRITPHAFAHDGLRWHCRAWCHDTRHFRDFLLPRILEVGSFGPPGEPGAADHDWHDRVEIILLPHPGLSPAQQAVVARDYGMENGRTLLPVRLALLYYNMRSLGLLDAPETRDPRSQHIIAGNAAALEEILKRVDVDASLSQASGSDAPDAPCRTL